MSKIDKDLEKQFQKLNAQLDKADQAAKIMSDTLDRVVGSPDKSEVDKLMEQIKDEIRLEKQSEQIEREKDQKLAKRFEDVFGTPPKVQYGEKTKPRVDVRKINSSPKLPTKKELEEPPVEELNARVDYSLGKAKTGFKPIQPTEPPKINAAQETSQIAKPKKQLGWGERIKNFINDLIKDIVIKVFGGKKQTIVAPAATQLDKAPVSSKEQIKQLDPAMVKKVINFQKNLEDLKGLDRQRVALVAKQKKARSVLKAKQAKITVARRNNKPIGR